MSARREPRTDDSPFHLHEAVLKTVQAIPSVVDRGGIGKGEAVSRATGRDESTVSAWWVTPTYRGGSGHDITADGIRDIYANTDTADPAILNYLGAGRFLCVKRPDVGDDGLSLLHHLAKIISDVADIPDTPPGFMNSMERSMLSKVADRLIDQAARINKLLNGGGDRG